MRLVRFVWIGLIPVLPIPFLLITGCAPLETSTQVQNLSPADAKALMDQRQNDPQFVIVDVRNPEEFSGGHIAGAINICYLCLGFQEQIASLDRSQTYLVYCGTDHRSPLALAAMQAAGFTSLYDLTGGLNAWLAAGLPVEQ